MDVNKWKWFVIKELFDIAKGERLTKDKRVYGNTPLLTAKSINNGVDCFIDRELFGGKKLFINKGTIDMFFHAFYHDYHYFQMIMFTL